jgi:kumamolisin
MCHALHLMGTGQTVALFELDNYYSADIQDYATETGIPLPSITVLPVPTGDSPQTPTACGEPEVVLDIDMVMSMAPKATILVYEGQNNQPPPYDCQYFESLDPPVNVLNQIAVDNLAKSISSSWTWQGTDSNITTIFAEYALQGQSFFQAAGDIGAYIAGDPMPTVPSPIWESNLMTVVGGTRLTTTGTGTDGQPTPVGTYVSETTWNDSPGPGATMTPPPNEVGGGGICAGQTPIPTWQVPFINPQNLGSSSYRNIPDVSLIADNLSVYQLAFGKTQAPELLYDGEGLICALRGTSAAAPHCGQV